MKRKIAVIGGGAAGFFAAIQAARKNPGSTVHILEASRKPLAKVIISGGGRCNVTNDTRDIRRLAENYPRGSRELLGAFSRFSVSNTIAWFEEHGVHLKTEPDQRMFPTTNSSNTIADCLIDAAAESGVIVELQQRVTSVQSSNDCYFSVNCRDSAARLFDIVILTTGGAKGGFKLAEDLGHTISTPTPSLFTFKINDPLLQDLSGISFPHTHLQLNVAGQKFVCQGPLLITHWGLSGPAIIKLSALAARELFSTDYQATLQVSFLSEQSTESLMTTFSDARAHAGKKLLSKTPLIEIPKRFWERIVALAGISTEQRIADCSRHTFLTITELLTASNLAIAGKGEFKEEFVTCGGVHLKEVDFRSMQSKKVPNLYFAGEVLDIDGITGGFNFQSAWTTGWIAGDSC